jgi:hypothetical protein
MSSAKLKVRAQTTVVAHNPLEGEQLLLDALYGAPPRLEPVPDAEPRAPERPPRPQHYKIISISLYTEDIDRLDRLVQELKRRGHYKANKSQIIREALARLDVDVVAPAR